MSNESKENNLQKEIDETDFSESIGEIIRWNLVEPIVEVIDDRIQKILKNQVIPDIMKQFEEPIKNFAESLKKIDYPIKS